MSYDSTPNSTPPQRHKFFGFPSRYTIVPSLAKSTNEVLKELPPTASASYGQQYFPTSLSSNANSEIADQFTLTRRSPSLARFLESDQNHYRNWCAEFQAIFKDYFNLRGKIPKLLKDFEDAATKIGKIIISERNMPNKTIPPLGKGELGVAGGEKYLCGTIFFKYAVDLFNIYGGDHFAQKAAGLELKHLNALFSLGRYSQRFFSFPLMTLIDYRGWRLIATSVLPIDETTIVYGSCDQGYSVHTDSEEFNELMRLTAKLLNLKEHTVYGKDGIPKSICAPIDIEGHIGKDSNFYLIDYQRLMPPETPNGTKGVHLYRLLRPEFVRQYRTPLNPDAFSVWGAHDATICNQEVMAATEELRTKVIPQLAEFLNSCDPHTLESHQLIREIHRRGINLRYLGLISDFVTDPATRGFLILEQVARIFGAMLRARFRAVQSSEEEDYLRVALDFFNLVFGVSEASTRLWTEDLIASLNAHFISIKPRENGEDLRGQLKMTKLFSRMQEVTAVTFSLQANKPFVLEDITAINVHTKRMISWLDPRAFQVAVEAGLPDARIKIVHQDLQNKTFIVEGVTGNIYRARWRNYDVAVTQFHKPVEFEQFRSAAAELCALSHPYLVRIFGYVDSPGCCVAEFVNGGTLQGLLEDEDREIEWSFRMKVAKQIAEGMTYLHSATPPWVHRNLTSANILLTGDGDIKINIVRLTRHIGFSCDTSFLGIIPPEIVEDTRSTWSEKSDVYCFGLILMELVIRTLPDLGDEFIPEFPADVPVPAHYADLVRILAQ